MIYYKYNHIQVSLMGSFITDIKVTLDNELGRDKPFHFKVITDGTEEDMIATVNKGLEQKKREGELTDEDIKRARSVKIDAKDEKGYFGTYVADIGNFFTSL